MSADNRYTTVSSREFNQDSAGAKRAAEQGPVYITDRGRPAHVLLNITEYRRLTGSAASLVELLAMPEAEGAAVDFDPPRLAPGLRPAAFD